MRDNYAFKKRSRELAKKKKREEKLQRKQDKKNPPVPDGLDPAANPEETTPVTDETVDSSLEGHSDSQ